MSSATIACPWCAKGIEVNADLQQGSPIQCPRCGANFAVLAEDLRAAVLAAPPPTALSPEPAAPAPAAPILPPPADLAPIAHPPASRVWTMLLPACAAATLLLMAAMIGAVVYVAGKRAPQGVALAAPAADAPKNADPTPPLAIQPPPSNDLFSVLPNPPDEGAPSRTAPPIAPPRSSSRPAAPDAPPVAPPPLVERPHPLPAPTAFRRRDQLAEEDLRKQLLQAPEMALDPPGDARGSTTLFTLALEAHNRGQAYPGPAAYLRQRTELNGLPLALGVDCQLGKEPAENLQALSHKMHDTFAACLPNNGVDLRPNPDELRQRLFDEDGKQWLTPDAIPCLLQILQPENKPVRLILVDALSRIPGKRATQALAMRAMMDLSPEVREAAIKALRDRPRDDCRDILLHGLRYPWAPVVDHAAEALVALDDKEAAPSLVPLLDLPDPSAPALLKKDKEEVKLVPEMVRVNHFRNCALCHPPSMDVKDLVRGAVPTQGRPLEGGPIGYGGSQQFVRADVTYLRQDFSVMQPVANPGAWPDFQRFDYLIRLRRPKMSDYETTDRKSRLGDEAREAVLFALRELTGRDAGATAASWRTALGRTATAGPAAPLTESSGDWRQFQAMLRPGTDASLSAVADRLRDKLLAADPAAQTALIHDLGVGDDLAGPTALARVIPFLGEAAQAQARGALADRISRLPEADLRERLGDDDPEVRRAAVRACKRREDKGKSLTAELIPLIGDEDNDVAEAAHAVLTAATGRDFGPVTGATPAHRQQAREAWETWFAGAKAP
ncbi:MAG TPA: HEAT repeat domain-containing protein [Gemmataceae bacterium]|nr:HEAT repeat domain-containing protein [Gemmataceae bacterium]